MLLRYRDESTPSAASAGREPSSTREPPPAAFDPQYGSAPAAHQYGQPQPQACAAPAGFARCRAAVWGARVGCCRLLPGVNQGWSQVTAPNMSQRGGKLGPMDEMDDDEFGVVDLDAVDDDRDVDTDAATATTRPEEPRRRIDESVKLPQSPRRAVSLPASVAPVARGAAIGAGVAVGANAVRKHPKTALAVAALGAAILATARARHRAAAADRRQHA